MKEMNIREFEAFLEKELEFSKKQAKRFGWFGSWYRYFHLGHQSAIGNMLQHLSTLK